MLAYASLFLAQNGNLQNLQGYLYSGLEIDYQTVEVSRLDADDPSEESLCASNVAILVANPEATHQRVSSIGQNDFTLLHCPLVFLQVAIECYSFALVELIMGLRQYLPSK